MGNCKDNCLKHFISCKYYDSTCLSLLLVLKKYNMLKKETESWKQAGKAMHHVYFYHIGLVVWSLTDKLQAVGLITFQVSFVLMSSQSDIFVI